MKRSARAVFFDRDGTLIENVDYLSDPDQVRVLPEAVAWVRRARDRGFETVVVTNQSGVGRGYYTEEDVHAVNLRVAELFERAGAPLDAFYHCPHAPDENGASPCACRKPAPGMILEALAERGIDPAASALIGNAESDLEAGRRAGLAAVFHVEEGERLLRWIAGPARYPLSQRTNLVSVEAFPEPPPPEACRDFDLLSALPDVLAGTTLRSLVGALGAARDRKRLRAWALGGHVVKVGLTPYFQALLGGGFVSLVACNGALPIHDLEIALQGATSEDVGASLNEGRFGMARETGDAFAEIVQRAAAGPGLGRAVGEYILEKNLPFRDRSLLAAAREAGVPVCVFPAPGAEITAMHPGHSGAALGRAAEIDFHRLVEALPGLGGGGAWINVGSAVVLPEVFLKALNLAVNLYGPLEGYTTANLDMIQHYRPRVNVIERPGSQGLALTGHHEILIPLLWACLAGGLAPQG